MKTFKAWLLVAVIWVLIVTTLHCLPGSRLPKISWQDKIFLDKWIHFFLFLLLVFLWSRFYSNKRSIAGVKKIFLTITILSMIYGIGMEVVQHYFIPFRSFAYEDIVADGLGSAAGYFISIKRFVKKPI
ncbi:MAG TPA: VanZ family protein [Chitinophagaceae bacterium]|nr:VanZ family protein [Chitinophagaceae bacterium]